MRSPRRLLVPANGLLTAVMLVLPQMAVTAEASTSLREAFHPHFLVGTALNRSHVTGSGGRRTAEQVAAEIALVKRHFNQITAENDMKWQLIHPREGVDGYDFGPADAFVDFGLTHGMYLAGHTLVWHSQTPDWVFAGTNPPPASASPAPRPGGLRPHLLGAAGLPRGAARPHARPHPHRRRPLQGEGEGVGRGERGPGRRRTGKRPAELALAADHRT